MLVTLRLSGIILMYWQLMMRHEYSNVLILVTAPATCFTLPSSVLARRASKRPMDSHFWGNWMANFQFLAESMIVGIHFMSGS